MERCVTGWYKINIRPTTTVWGSPSMPVKGQGKIALCVFLWFLERKYFSFNLQRTSVETSWSNFCAVQSGSWDSNTTRVTLHQFLFPTWNSSIFTFPDLCEGAGGMVRDVFFLFTWKYLLAFKVQCTYDKNSLANFWDVSMHSGTGDPLNLAGVRY